jgi:hypothetical protein
VLRIQVKVEISPLLKPQTHKKVLRRIFDTKGEEENK